MLEHNGRLVLLEEEVLLGVLEQISIFEEFGHYVDMVFGLVLLDELDDVGVETLLEDADLPLEDVSLGLAELAGLDDLDRHLFL